MKILITGGYGFLGRHLIRQFDIIQHEIMAFTRERYDLLDSRQTNLLMGTTKPEIVIHLAAVVGGIGANQKSPGRFIHANLQMGLNVLEACREHNVRKLVQIGTVCAYPKFTPVPFKESDLWNGYPEETNAPYGIAKRALIEAGRAYRKEYGLNVVTMIPTNLYGPGDSIDPENSHVIPALIRKCLQAKAEHSDTVQVWGSGKATRDFLYVDDAARGIAQAALNYDGDEPVNLGSGRETSIDQVLEIIAKETGFQGSRNYHAERPDGQPRRWLDISRARERLGWSPTTELEDGIKLTIDDVMTRILI